MEPTAGAERCRTSQPGSRRVTSNLRRRTSQQHQMVRRMSAANLAGRRGSISMLAVPGGWMGRGLRLGLGKERQHEDH